jgi:hypothetical protein
VGRAKVQFLGELLKVVERRAAKHRMPTRADVLACNADAIRRFVATSSASLAASKSGLMVDERLGALRDMAEEVTYNHLVFGKALLGLPSELLDVRAEIGLRTRREHTSFWIRRKSWNTCNHSNTVSKQLRVAQRWSMQGRHLKPWANSTPSLTTLPTYSNRLKASKNRATVSKVSCANAEADLISAMQG